MGASFFLLLVVSALASAISLLELVVAWATETFRISRPSAAYASAACWIVGLGTVLSSFNTWSSWHPLTTLATFEPRASSTRSITRPRT